MASPHAIHEEHSGDDMKGIAVIMVAAWLCSRRVATTVENGGICLEVPGGRMGLACVNRVCTGKSGDA